MLEFHITDGAILHLCWVHRIFNETAYKRYLLPIQEMIYKRLSDYFSGFTAKSKNTDLPVSHNEMNDSGKNKKYNNNNYAGTYIRKAGIVFTIH